MTGPAGQALDEMAGHALDVSQRVDALGDHMAELGWSVDSYPRIELREIAARLHSTSIQAALVSGSTARLQGASGLSLQPLETDFRPSQPHTGPPDDDQTAHPEFAAEEVKQWVSDMDTSDPWHLTLPGMADDLVILRADRDRLQSELDQLRTAITKHI